MAMMGEIDRQKVIKSKLCALKKKKKTRVKGD
jgi:hypothetical protein